MNAPKTSLLPRPAPPQLHRSRSTAVPAGLMLGLILISGGLTGCSSLEPWVKPYERERLADPIMQFTREPLIEKHREHVYSVREGARGATGVQGGGCGCN